MLLKKRFIFHTIFYLSVFIIGYIDFYADVKISFKAVFFIPLYFYVINPATTKKQCYLFALLISVTWSFVYFLNIGSNLYLYLIINFLISISSVLLFTHFIYTLKIQRGNLNRLNAQLIISNEEKNRMLGIAAHDLRSPIAKIFQITELLTDDAFRLPGEKKKKFIEMIKATCSDMLTLLNKTLDFSKIESGKLDLKKQKIEYVNFVEKAIENNIFFAEKKGIRIILEAFVSNILIELDTDHFNQVMDNLLSNAIKYSYPNSKIIIRVSKNENTLITEIVDLGVGIKADELERIFFPFQRSTSKPTSGESSTGLGLFIVKRIIEEHHGTITLSSIEDQGTSVTFRLAL